LEGDVPAECDPKALASTIAVAFAGVGLAALQGATRETLEPIARTLSTLVPERRQRQGPVGSKIS
jgi:hypothetical protein